MFSFQIPKEWNMKHCDNYCIFKFCILIFAQCKYKTLTAVFEIKL